MKGFLDVPKVWRCMLHGTSLCSKTRVSPCTWASPGAVAPPKNLGCKVGAAVLQDHIEKVVP